MKMTIVVLLITLTFAAEKKTETAEGVHAQNEINKIIYDPSLVKIEEDELATTNPKKSIEQRISYVEDVIKKMEANLNYGLFQRVRDSSYMIQMSIPPGVLRNYGAHSNKETAQKAVSMIVNEYLESLKLVQNGQKKSPTTFKELKAKYDKKPSNLATIPIDAKISKVRNLLKKIEMNANKFLLPRQLVSHECSYEVKPTIPLGAATHCYGVQYNQTTAQKAVLMIVKEYLKSLELVQEGKCKFPATAEELQLKYDELFPNMLSKFENTLKKIEKNPNFGLNKTLNGRRFTIQLTIPPGNRHKYGVHHDHTAARKAVLMIADEYRKSLKLVQNGELEYPATAHDLQQKYDAMFSKSHEQIMTSISKFVCALKKIEQNPNYGMHLCGKTYYINLYIPRGTGGHSYGHYHDHETARKAVLMIAHEYMKSLELVREGKVKHPATVRELQLKHDAMFGEIQKENELEIVNGKKSLLKIFQMTQNPNQIHEENGITSDSSELEESLFNGRYNNNLEIYSKEQSKERDNENLQGAKRQRTRDMIESIDEQNKASHSEGSGEEPSNNVYKISRIWNTQEDEPKHNFYLEGYFKVMSPPDVFWVNTIKKVDGRLSGYYEEYGGCRGWVNLEYIDSTDFDGPKEMNETLKRKREESENSIEESESEESTSGSSNNYKINQK